MSVTEVTYDLIVAGGGMAGIGAALAAARRGATTLLIERLSQLGGLATAGAVGNFSYTGEPVGLGRVFEDVWAGLAEMEAIGEEYGWRVGDNPTYGWVNTQFDHQVLPLVLQELLARDGVTVLFATDVIGAEMDGRALTGVRIQNRSFAQRARGRRFVDATGDGILAWHAGAELLPVEDAGHPDPIQPSLMVMLRRVEGARPQAVPRRYYRDAEPRYSIWTEPRGRVALKIWLREEPVHTTTGEAFSDAEALFRARIPEVVRHFQEHHDPHYEFDFAAPMLGLRESRRARGEAVLTAADIRAGRHFPDSVAHGVFSIDTHRLHEVVPPYQIPYGALLARGVENLLVAGRGFSADRLALASARVIPTGCLMGQAAGIAAALSTRDGVALRAVDPAAIRAALLADALHADALRARLLP
ncbi:MAG TPA: FAD-dependent oxidoreductase [Armatimonadota bacterium]|mgnify:CR=1 FL=1|nr:FAD-dependent oxidoreductase [Armatimonadota bacterium]HOS42255.1 FAD-dependent oxidoreductase [Armatimonadota bacterium]